MLKRYHPEAVKNIIDTGVGIDEHTKKAVQMPLLARNFTSQLTSSLAPEAAIKFNLVKHFDTVTCTLVKQRKGSV